MSSGFNILYDKENYILLIFTNIEIEGENNFVY